MARLSNFLRRISAPPRAASGLLALLVLFAVNGRGQVFKDRMPACSGSWETAFTEHDKPKSNGMGGYTISTPGQLAYVDWALNNDNQTVRNQYANASFTLTADLDMGAHYWERVGIRQNFAGTLDGNGHTIKNLYCYQESAPSSNHCGSMFGMASGATFKNLTMYNCFGEGGKFTSILVGQAMGSVTFDNVHLVKCGLTSHGNHYVGGFVGITEQQAINVNITNCSSDVYVTDVKTAVGGFIGQVSGTNTVVVMDNCVSRTVGNGYFDNPPAVIQNETNGLKKNLDGKSYWQHGGFVGATANAVDFQLSRIASYTSSREQNLMSAKWYKWVHSDFWGSDVFDYYTAYKNAGAVIGGWHSNVNPRIESDRIFIDADATSLSSLWEFAMGLTSEQPRNAGADLRTVIKSLKKDNEAFAVVAKLNEEGMALTLKDYGDEHYATPLTSDEGKIVAFKGYSETELGQTNAYKTDDRANVWIKDPLTGIERAYFAKGKNAYYSAVPNNAQYWVMEDNSTNMSGKSRTDKAWFKGQPTAGGELKFTVKMKPVVQWNGGTGVSYSKMRQQTKLSWIFKQEVDIDAWKAKGAYFRIYRNGEKVDSIEVSDNNSYEWTDKTPKTGSVNKYDVKVVCPSVFFDEEDNYMAPSATISCTGIAAPVLSVEGQVGNIKLVAKVPNSVAFDSCKVAIFKHVVLAGDEDAVLKDSTDKSSKLLGEQVFHCNKSVSDTVVKVSFADKSTSQPCNKWVYEVVCYDFPKGSEAYNTWQWGNAEPVLPDSKIAIASFTASKGESTNQISLAWKRQDVSSGYVNYVLKRKIYTRGEYAKSAVEDTTGWEFVTSVENAKKENSYKDNVLPGYVYKYMLEAHPSCDGKYSDNIFVSANAIGFAASRGTIMGRVTYSGNTAVKGVDMRLTTEESSFSQKGGSYVLYFDGDGSKLPVASGLDKGFWNGDWCLSFMVLPIKRDTLTTLATLPGHFSLGLKQEKLYVSGNECLKMPNSRSYNCILLRHDKSAKKLSVGYAYNDGKTDTVAYWKGVYDDASIKQGLPAASTEVADTLVFGGGFEGYLDEVRLWDTKFSDSDIADTYNRYLSGTEKNLAAYYTFDSGVEEYAFDTSRPGGKSNDHDCAIPSPGHPYVTDAMLVPEDILAYRGVTDKNGEYQISGIPFMGEGTNYLVVPVMGTHEFSPSTTRRYVSQQSLSHSGVDFTDKSSFTVPVQAYYVYGSLPVEGLNVYVDGVAQRDGENQEILTDKYGKATVSVPIGQHKLTLGGFRHTMVNSGAPCSVEVVTENGKCRINALSKDKGYLDFQRDLTDGYLFYDSTMVRVAGLIAGGKDEAAKPVGFGKGKANMGSYKFVLEPTVSGNVLSDEVKFDSLTIVPDSVPYDIKSRTVYSKGKVTVETDASTGEYVAMLPPVQWNVKSLVSKTGGVEDFVLKNYSRLISPNLKEEKADTVWNDGVTRKDPTQTDTYKTFKYFVRQDYIKYNNPFISVVNLRTVGAEDSDSLMLGDKIAAVPYWDEDKDVEVNDTVRMWRSDVPHDGTSASYALGHPVFSSGSMYGFRIRLMEKYTNHDNKVETLVPVRNSKVSISNKCAITKATVLSTGDYELADSAATQKTDSTLAGIVDYEFLAGLPNMSGDYLLPIQITYNVNGKEGSWETLGYVTGGVQKANGQNFVTKGPSLVRFVLFDPPGSNSYAYVESGTTMMAKTSLSFRSTSLVDKKWTAVTKTVKCVLNGVDAQGNIVVDHRTEVNTDFSTSKNITANITTGYDKEWNETYVLTNRVATSADPKSVGASADLYVGNAVNIVVSEGNFLDFSEADDTQKDYVLTSDKGHRFCLKKYTKLGAGSEQATSFMYTQNQIVTQIIPDLVKMRNALVKSANIVETLPEADAKSKTGRYEYYVLKSAFDKVLWDEGNATSRGDYVSLPPEKMSKGIVADSVNMYNEQIRVWQSQIRSVETYKLGRFQDLEKKRENYVQESGTIAFDFGYLGNTSYAADGSGMDVGFSATQTCMGSWPKSESFTYKYSKNDGRESSVGNDGGAITGHFNVLSLGTGETLTVTGTAMGSGSVKMGYHLQDNDIDDRFSVDVFLPYLKRELTSVDLAAGRNAFVPEPYVFCLKGGQTRTPWEKQQMTLYAKVGGQSVPLDAGSVSLDVPSIHFAKRRVVDVPVGEAATVEVEMANESTGTSTLSYLYPYNFRIVSGDNVTKGLNMSIDGKPLDGYSFLMPPGHTYKRTVTFKQSDPGVLEYDDIPVMIYSMETAVDTISIHFKPTAPNVNIKANGSPVINASNKTQKALMTLDGYDSKYYHFAGINLQYREKDKSEDWQTQYTLINDSALYRDVKGVMPGTPWRKLAAGMDTLSFDLSKLNDGTYEVRAETFTLIGNETIEKFSDIVEVVKDTQSPKLFGVPSPSGSVYTGREEISVTFNEDIDPNNLNAANFTASGAINDAPANHTSGLHFDGNAPAYTASRVNLLGARRGLGLWYKPQTGKKSCLLSQTLTDTRGISVPFKVWYNEDASLGFEVYGRTYTSKKKALREDGQPLEDWMYLMVMTDNGTGNAAGNRVIHLYNMYNTSTLNQSDFVSVDTLNDIWFVNDNEAGVPLYVGGSETGDACHADMEGLVIYGEAADVATVYSEKASKHTANLRGIEAYWPMDEGYGAVAEDKVRSRNLRITGGQYNSWYVPYENYVMHFDGKSQYAVLNTERSGIGKNEDFVLEFLFRSSEENPRKHMTIFSSGYGGEGSKEEPTDVFDRLSVALTEAGAIELNAGGQTYVMGSGYADGKAHSFSLNVHRDAFATVSVDTVDISDNKLISGMDLGAFSNSRMCIGARRYHDAGKSEFLVDDFFAGDIDELRVWKMYKTAANVNNNVLVGLKGDEAGLVSYYPFERTDRVANANKTTPTIEDRVTDKEYHDALPVLYGYGTQADSAKYAEVATLHYSMGLKPYNVDSPIALSFTTSKSMPNKVVLSFADYVKNSSIQGCTVDFTAKDVRDLAGNYIDRPISWTTYVDMRDVRWQPDDGSSSLSFVQQLSNETEWYASKYVPIVNNSVNTVNWTISNVPSWITLDKTSGTLAPGATTGVTVSCNKTASIGRYSGVLYISSDANGVDDALDVSLTVTAVSPNWQPDKSEYEQSMTLKGRLKVNGQWSTDEQSLVGAFDAMGYCHGVASPVYSKDLDMYLVSMTIQGPMAGIDQNVYFKVWDSQSGLTYTHVYLSLSGEEPIDKLPYAENKIYGSFANLCTIEPVNEVQQTFNLKKGWNWVSNWIQPKSNDIERIFDLNNYDNIMVTDIKRRSGDATDVSFTPAESYHLYAMNSGTLTIAGDIIRPDTVKMVIKGAAGTKNKCAWSWIGYPEYTNLTLEEAFSDFVPLKGDVVKNQKGYSMYNGKRWEGDISYLSPGEGYLYGSVNEQDVVWTYPYKPNKGFSLAEANVKPALSVSDKSALSVAAEPFKRFSCDRYKYAGNMSLLGTLLVDGEAADSWQIGAFVDGVCRGWQTADSTGRVFLTVSGDGAGTVTYRACDTRTGAVVPVEQQTEYVGNAILGSFDSPYLLVAEMPSHYAIDEKLPYSYEDYTFVTATVLQPDETLYPHDYELAAFCGSECRGVSVGKAGKTCPIAIFGTDHETYTFKLWDKETQEEIELVGTKEYNIKDGNQKVTLRVPDTSGINGVQADGKDADHRWYDTKGIFHGKQPHEKGVYIKDNQKVLHNAQ